MIRDVQNDIENLKELGSADDIILQTFRKLVDRANDCVSERLPVDSLPLVLEPPVRVAERGTSASARRRSSSKKFGVRSREGKQERGQVSCIVIHPLAYRAKGLNRRHDRIGHVTSF